MSRKLCSHCQRPLATCLCNLVRPTDNRVELVILQHPGEVKQAKNTASLLELSLSQCQKHIGEQLEPELLTQILRQDKTNLLLYPDTPDPTIPVPPATEIENLPPEQLRLIVLDGTWRKSQKMLYLNPALQALPRLSLESVPPSRYHIRVAPKAGQLSTLEASCYALTQLEQDPGTYKPLLEAFDKFVEQQLQWRPAAHNQDPYISDL